MGAPIAQPDRQPPGLALRIGKSVTLREVKDLAHSLGQSIRATSALLDVLQVPILGIGHRRLFNEAALEQAIFAVTCFGGPGLAAPGSETKRHRRTGDPAALPTSLPTDFPTSRLAQQALRAQGKAASSYNRSLRATLRDLLGTDKGRGSAPPT